MLTDGNMIRLVRVGNEFWIGTLEPGGNIGAHTLTAPRVLGQTPDKKWAFVEMLGKPAEIDIPSGQYILFSVTDEAMIAAYREAVTGLTLAKTIPNGLVRVQ